MSISVNESYEIYKTHFANIPEQYYRSKQNFNIKVEGSRKPGYSHVYRSAVGPEILEVIHPKLNNLEILFQHAVNLFPNENCLGKRLFDNTVKGGYDNFFTFQTYSQILERRNNIASGIIHFVTSQKGFIRTDENFKNGKPSFVVSLYSSNRLEFVLSDLACSAYSLPTTALYDTLGPESSKHILNLTQSPVLILSKDKIGKILELKEQFGLEHLLVLVSMDPLTHKDHDLRYKAKDLDLELIDYSQLEKLGRQNHLWYTFNPPTPETIHHICFTSGTTGLPKGCVLTHRNSVGYVVAQQVMGRGFCSVYHGDSGKPINNRDDEDEQFRYLSGLPLAHIYERSHTTNNIMNGVSVGFPTLPGVQSVMEDWRILHPHSVAGVPRLWNKVEQTIRGLLEGFNLDQKNASTVDRLLIRNKIRKFFGFDKTRFMNTGSAPLSHDTVSFIAEYAGIGFIQGYGMTETVAGIMGSDPFNDGYNTSSVGGCYPTVEVKLKDAPNLNYTSNDSPMIRGELLCKGTQIFGEYYKNEEATKECFEEDGYFKTGDVAGIDEQGRIYIIDRVKNFFKLSQGEYVTPERIENTYLANCHLITQIFVHGNSYKNYLVAVLGVEPVRFKALLKKSGIDAKDEDIPKYFKDPKIKKALIKTVNNQVNKSGLQGFEKIHNVYLDFEPLKTEDGVLTPTLKLKRENARKQFKEVLEGLYEEGSLYHNERL